MKKMVRISDTSGKELPDGSGYVNITVERKGFMLVRDGGKNFIGGPVVFHIEAGDEDKLVKSLVWQQMESMPR